MENIDTNKRTKISYIGKICPYCKTEFKEDDEIVVCSVCEMPHHKECWIENKACTTFGCTGTIAGRDQNTDLEAIKKFCPQCGAKIEKDQKFCSYCGTPTSITSEPHFKAANSYDINQTYQNNNSSQQYYQYNTKYNAYAQQYSLDQDLYNFIHSNQSTYITKFQRMEMLNTNVSWNWCSFFFNGFWYAYRRMPGIAAAYIGITFVLNLIPVFGYILQIILNIFSGIYGDYFYKKYVERELKIVKNMDLSNKSVYIFKKGGTNVGAVFAVMAVAFVLGCIMSSI